MSPKNKPRRDWIEFRTPLRIFKNEGLEWPYMFLSGGDPTQNILVYQDPRTRPPELPPYQEGGLRKTRKQGDTSIWYSVYLTKRGQLSEEEKQNRLRNQTSYAFHQDEDDYGEEG